MENYNIKEFITRSDENQLKNKIKLQIFKNKNKKPSLNLILINKNFIYNNKCKRKKNNNNNFYDKRPLYYSPFKNEGTQTKINIHENNINEYNKSNFQKELYKIKFDKINYNSDKKSNNQNKNKNINSINKEKNKKQLSAQRMFSQIFNNIFTTRQAEQYMNKQLQFKKLKNYIKKHELKVKDIIYDLWKLRNNNDENLKRKGFIIRKINIKNNENST